MDNKIVNEIMKLRDRHNLSQAGLGRLMEVDQSTICDWETGRHNVPGPARVLIRMLLARKRLP